MKRTRIRLTWMAIAVIVSIAPRASHGGTADGFDTRWRDGKAELDGYRLEVDRYGHPRVGRAVMIYVTEPFSRSKHVKLDDPSKADPSDVLDVLKLNLVRSFQTGIYDYHTMTSLFVTASDFTPLKVAFSSSEWCGQVYEQLDIDRHAMKASYASYFEGESASQSSMIPEGAVVEDDLFVLLRGLRGPYLAPGEKRSTPFLASPFIRRLAHRPLEFGSATIERLDSPQSIEVPAGAFSSDVFVVKPSDGREGRFFVEREEPNRVLRWEWNHAAEAAQAHQGLGGTDAGELTGTAREPYWREHDPGDEKYLEKLGLAPPILP